jgi:hypothetical protein
MGMNQTTYIGPYIKIDKKNIKPLEKDNTITITTCTNADCKIHISKFKKDIKSEHKIVKSTTTDKRSGKKFTSYTISITNYNFVKKLQKFISVDKSFNFHLPKLKDSLYLYFIAGMFDGDGSLSIKNKKIRSSLISTKECLEEIQIILQRNNIGKTKILNHYSTFRFHLYKDSYNFLKFVYDDKFSYLYLSRKYLKFKNYEKTITES